MMKSFATMLVLLTLSVCSASSSACLFPCFPTYSAGYYGWGNRCGYPAYPAYRYGYAPSYGVSYGGYGGGCANGSCGTTYTAGYPAYTGGCCNSCGLSSCCGGCSTCGTTGCSANCISSDRVITDPTPDPLSDDKTYSDPDRGYDRDLDRNLGRDRRTDDPIAPGGASRPETQDDFRGSDRDWNPRGTDSDPLDDDFGSGGMFGAESRKPPMEDGAREFGADPDDIPAGTADPDAGAGGGEDAGIIDRSASKPAITDPLKEEQGGDDDVDAAAEDAPAPAPPSTEDADDSGAEETEDVLSPETSVAPRARMIFASQSATRSRLHDVVRPGFARRVPVAQTRISSSEKKQQPARWISVPRPAGRVRL